jgi:proline iminopeptidase
MSSAIEGMIPVPGGQVWYRIVGGEAPGLPLLVLHGGPGAPHDYLENLAALADERPVVFYDQLGCGRSERPDDPALWQLPRFVAELAAVREALGLGRIHLLGQSWGTLLAVQALLSGAKGIERLVLSAPCLSAPRWIADQRAWLAQMPQPVREAVDSAEAQQSFEAAPYQDAMTAYYKKHLCRLDPWPDCLQRSFAGLGMQVYLTLWGPSEFTCTGSLREVDLTPQLSQIRVPTLLTCGRFDEATPAAVEDFRRLIPGARMQIFEESSHEHHLEQSHEYLSVVREFLR